MNKKGNIMINMLAFVMALGIVVAMIPVVKIFVDMAQESDSLNCRGYIHYGDVNSTLSFNNTLNGGNSGSPLGCLAIKLYLPYILLGFLIFGAARLFAQKGSDMLGIGGDSE